MNETEILNRDYLIRHTQFDRSMLVNRHTLMIVDSCPSGKVETLRTMAQQISEKRRLDAWLRKASFKSS